MVSRSAAIFLGLTCALLAACAARERPRAAPPAFDFGRPIFSICGRELEDVRFLDTATECRVRAREVKAFGSVPGVDPVPPAHCPMRIRAEPAGVIAEPAQLVDSFDPLPWDECVPGEYATGARHVLRVDDGFLVAYDGTLGSELRWYSDDGLDKHLVSNARIVGFSRSKSGAPLALGVGRARLGRGAVMRLEHGGRGDWTLRLVAVLPIEPSPAFFDDHGTIVGYAQRFVFRTGEDGRVDNVHYVSRDLGNVGSIARAQDGSYYLGVECGVLRLVPDPAEGFREEWWSAKDGASGRWSWCPY